MINRIIVDWLALRRGTWVGQGEPRWRLRRWCHVLAFTLVTQEQVLTASENLLSNMYF